MASVLETDSPVAAPTSPVAAAIEKASPSPEAHPTSTPKLVALCLALALVCFLVWLDEGILATAIPSVANEFRAFEDLAWYSPSYLFGLCTFQLAFGRIYQDFSPRPTYLCSVLLFEAASILQGAAPTSAAFIVGRVLAGVGGAGVLSGTLVIFTAEIPKKWLPTVMGCFSWIHGIGSITGPLIGGAFASSRLTWRWCFYINPIISAVAVVPILVVFARNQPDQDSAKRPSAFAILRDFDYFGLVAFAGATVAILLALQVGSSVYSWSDWRTILCFVVGGVALVGFVVIEHFKGAAAMVPLRVAADRTVAICSVYSGTLDSGYYVLVYFLPVWFQAVQRDNAFASGYRILPMLILDIVCGFSSAALSGVVGFYQPFMLVGACLLAVGAGLLTLLKPGAPPAQWIVFQLLAGAGAGFGGQLPLVAVQDILPLSKVSVGYAIVLTAGNFGSTAALAIAQAVFSAGLQSRLSSIPGGPDPEQLLADSGASDLASVVQPELLQPVVAAYSDALTQSWFFVVALAAVAFVCVFGVKWKRMDKERKDEEGAGTPSTGEKPEPVGTKADTKNEVSGQ